MKQKNMYEQKSCGNKSNMVLRYFQKGTIYIDFT